jgi:hypothetical protein
VSSGKASPRLIGLKGLLALKGLRGLERLLGSEGLLGSEELGQKANFRFTAGSDGKPG